MKIPQFLSQYRGFIRYVYSFKCYKFPLTLSVETSSLCNLNCRMCPSRKGSNVEKGNMTFYTFLKIINEFSFKRPQSSLILHKDGEPFMNPNLLSMIEYVKKKNLTLGYIQMVHY